MFLQAKSFTLLTKASFAIVIMSWACAGAHAQDTLSNRFSFIRAVHNRVVSSTDSFKIRNGYWIEHDTVYIPLVDLTDRKNEIINQAPMIYTAKGNYRNNAKDNLWKYYDADNNLYKQVSYRAGTVYFVEYYYPGGQVHLKATRKPDSTFDYECYDKSGRKISSGNIPSQLLQAATNLSTP